MKKFLFMAFALSAMSLSAQDVATQDVTTDAKVAIPQVVETPKADAPATPIVTPKDLKVRYIDDDKLFEEYIAAQNYDKLRTKLNNDYKASEEKKRKQIETFYNQVQTKYNSNQYKTEAAFEADKKKLEQMQETAQKEMEALQKKMETQLNSEYSKVLNEINAFLADYSNRNDIDVLLRKGSAMFIKPKWDVTSDVVKGLNDQYRAKHPATTGKKTGGKKTGGKKTGKKK